MKLKAIKPIYIGGVVVAEGSAFETLEQHGRELLNKGYASALEEEGEAAQPETTKRGKK